MTAKSKFKEIHIGGMNWAARMENQNGDLVIRFYGCGDIADNPARGGNLASDLKIVVLPEANIP